MLEGIEYRVEIKGKKKEWDNYNSIINKIYLQFFL